MNETCPICKGFLASMPGTSISPKDGVTVWCPSKSCSMADWGHGKTEKDALEVFKQKCGKV